MRAGSVPYDRQGRGQEAQSAVGFPGVIDACKATTPPGKPTFSRVASITPFDP